MSMLLHVCPCCSMYVHAAPCMSMLLELLYLPVHRIHKLQCLVKKYLCIANLTRSPVSSSPPRAFPFTWGRRNGNHSASTSSSFNPTLSIPLLHESFHLVFSLPLRLFRSTGASNILLSTCPSSLLLTCPYHFYP